MEILPPPGHIFAYHGTVASAVPDIIDCGLQRTIGGGHWLGDDGVYFSPDDARFAYGYALNRFPGEDIAILRAAIDLQDCFDLTTVKYKEILESFASTFIPQIPDWIWKEIPQTQITRGVDSLVIGQAMKTLRTPENTTYSSLRAIIPARFGALPAKVYPRSRPLYQIDVPGREPKCSWIDMHDHVQLIVYNEECIKDVVVYPEQ